MEELLSYCGLQCHTCPIYLATRIEDDAERRRVRTRIAEQCREVYGVALGPEEITDCDGCRTGGWLFTGCATCRVRKCAQEKNLTTCAECAEYPCAELQAHLAKEPDARKRLEEIRATRFRKA